MSGGRRIALAIFLGLAIVAAGVVVTLSRSSPRLAGSNAIVERSGVSLAVPPLGGVRCQDDEIVPRETAKLRLFFDTLDRPAGPVDVTISTGGRPGVPPRVVAHGRVAAPFRSGTQEVALSPRLSREVPGGRVCFVNHGRSAVTLSGNETPVSGSGANPSGSRLNDEPRVDYLYAAPRSWWSMAPTVARRFGLVKTSFFGSWTLWAVFGVLALLWAGTIVLLWRVVPRS